MTLPSGFIDLMASYGSEWLDGLPDALSSTRPPVSVRLNRSKDAAAPAGAACVPWCADGYYLDGRPQFTFDPALHQGRYYVQDASSMAIARAIARIAEDTGARPLRYLDACAAPGGKTTAAMTALPAGSFTVANEYDYRRAAVLAENVAKWGNPAVMVTRGDTSRLSQLQDTFDIVAADVPCSGEGMMRKDAEAVAQWSTHLIAECAARQREIVTNLWPALRPGGYMIYSTCTFNRTENEETVEWICRELGGVTVDTGLTSCDGVAPAIGSDIHAARFIPGRIEGEGLFLCVIRKDGDAAASQPKAAKKPLTALSRAGAEQAWVRDRLDGDFTPVQLRDNIAALPSSHAAWIRAAASWLDTVSAGVTVAAVKGRDLLPAQELALSTALRRDAFPTVETDYPTAIACLRREALSVDAPKGFVLLTYGGHPLAFVKNIGNRANNLYPQAWRILSPSLPDTPPAVIKSANQ